MDFFHHSSPLLLFFLGDINTELDIVSESLYILALKHPLNLNDIDIQEGIMGPNNNQESFMNDQTSFMSDLIKEVVNIPLKERAEKLISYQIHKK